jgi:hypothetical protein
MTGVTTVHLGQFTDEHANEIAGELERLGIAWWYKQPGYLSRVWERGTRLFVDETRLDEAKAVALRVLQKGDS